MKKKSKILLGLSVFFCAFIINITSISAASCRIGVSAPSSAVVGRSFTVTVTVSSGSPIGSWQYTLSYDSSKVRYNSGNLRVVDYGNGSKTSASYSYSFTALTSGTVTFKPINADVMDWTTTSGCLSSTGSASVSMKTQAEIEASYSRNNNLSSISIDGAELSPTFSADTLEYTTTLPIDTVKANITATPADSTATITGAGSVDVVDGINKIQIVVTAQHGETKTYTINLTVLELDPVKVKVDGINYTIVRKASQVKNVPTGFVEGKIKIKNQEVVSYTSTVTKQTLVALKDTKGNVSLFVYDKSNKTYSIFKEVKSASLNIAILSGNIEVPKEFKKVNFDYDKQKVVGYTLNNKDNYYLVYAEDLSTGKKDLYLYNKKDNTFQIYYDGLTNKLNNDIRIREYIILGLGGLFILIILIKFLKSLASKETKIKRLTKKLDKLNSKSVDTYDILKEEPQINKIDEDDFLPPKKSKKERQQELKEAKEKLKSNKNTIKRVSLEDYDDEEL